MKINTSINFNFKGDLKLKYKIYKINAIEADYNIFLDEKESKIELIVLFNPETFNNVLKYFPETKNGTSDTKYGFTLKPQIIDMYKKDFDAALTFEEFISIGNFACLNLENFTYIFPKFDN